jgi:thiamine phosphate synthase YjbQ (UPF0047 family)
MVRKRKRRPKPAHCARREDNKKRRTQQQKQPPTQPIPTTTKIILQQINIQGLKHKKREIQKYIQLQRSRCNKNTHLIIGLTETWLTEADTMKIKGMSSYQKERPRPKTAKTRHSGGLMILVDNTLDHSPMELVDEHDDIIKINVGQHEIILAYAPNGATDPVKSTQYYQTLQNNTTSDNTIIFGDLNAKTTRSTRCTRANDLNGDLLENIIRKHGLTTRVSTKTCKCNPLTATTQCTFTWYRGPHRSIIDHCVHPENISAKHGGTIHKHHVNFGSDHVLMETTLTFDELRARTEQARRTKETRTTYKETWHKNKEEQYTEELTKTVKALTNALVTKPRAKHSDKEISDFTRELTEAMRKVALKTGALIRMATHTNSHTAKDKSHADPELTKKLDELIEQRQRHFKHLFNQTKNNHKDREAQMTKLQKLITGKNAEIRNLLSTAEKKAERTKWRAMTQAKKEKDMEAFWTNLAKTRQQQQKHQEREQEGNDKGLKTEDGQHLPTATAQVKGWAKYYQQHDEQRTREASRTNPQQRPHQHANKPSQDKLHREQAIMNSRITAKQLKTAIKKRQRKKAPGPDGIYNEMIKATNTETRTAILTLFNNLFDGATVPTDTARATIAPIHKGQRKPKEKMKSYRPICLTSNLLKLYETILDTKLRTYLYSIKAISRLQKGSQPKRGALTTFLLLHEIKRWHYLKEGTQCRTMFIDLSQAYDTINRDKLWEKLESYGINNNIIESIQNIYKQTSYQVRWKERTSQTFTMNNGIQQGSVLSPILYILYTNDMMNHIDSNCTTGVKITEHEKIPFLMFVDDIVLIAPNDKALNTLLYRLNIYTGNNDLKMNIDKTMTIDRSRKDQATRESWTRTNLAMTESKDPISQNRAEYQTQINPIHHIEDADKYKYMGVTIRRLWRSWDDHIKKRVSLANYQARTIANTGINIGNASQPVIKLSYEATIRPIIEYGLAVIPLTKTQIAKLETTQHGILTMLCKTPRRLPKVVLQTELQIEPIEQRIWNTKLTMFHGIRTNSKSHPLLYKLWNSIKPEHLWNQEKTFLNEIDSIAKKLGLTNNNESLPLKSNISKGKWANMVNKAISRYTKTRWKQKMQNLSKPFSEYLSRTAKDSPNNAKQQPTHLSTPNTANISRIMYRTGIIPDRRFAMIINYDKCPLCNKETTTQGAPKDQEHRRAADHILLDCKATLSARTHLNKHLQNTLRQSLNTNTNSITRAQTLALILEAKNHTALRPLGLTNKRKHDNCWTQITEATNTYIHTIDKQLLTKQQHQPNA